MNKTEDDKSMLVGHITKFNEDIKELCLSGLLTHGAHHKQWFLEKILEKTGYNLKILRKQLYPEGYEWEDGIPP